MFVLIALFVAVAAAGTPAQCASPVPNGYVLLGTAQMGRQSRRLVLNFGEHSRPSNDFAKNPYGWRNVVGRARKTLLGETGTACCLKRLLQPVDLAISREQVWCFKESAPGTPANCVRNLTGVVPCQFRNVEFFNGDNVITFDGDRYPNTYFAQGNGFWRDHTGEFRCQLTFSTPLKATCGPYSPQCRFDFEWRGGGEQLIVSQTGQSDECGFGMNVNFGTNTVFRPRPSATTTSQATLTTPRAPLTTSTTRPRVTPTSRPVACGPDRVRECNVNGREFRSADNTLLFEFRGNETSNFTRVVGDALSGDNLGSFEGRVTFNSALSGQLVIAPTCTIRFNFTFNGEQAGLVAVQLGSASDCGFDAGVSASGTYTSVRTNRPFPAPRTTQSDN